LAILAAAGLFVGGVGVPSAKAADLGGDCCADLEERVAELEATTARKGNRKMSLTISGQVHRMILWWDDGHDSDAFYGLDNTNSSSRFIFSGSAKVTSQVSTGFDIMVEIEAGGTSSKVSQWNEDGAISAASPLGNGVSFNAGNQDAYGGDWRWARWWIDHKDIGRLTVGRTESAGAVTTVDLAGIGLAASGSMILVNGSFNIRNSDGDYLALTWGALGDPASNQGRTELIRYDSPTIAGFIASASIGEAGDYWGAMLRYAGEFSGVRIAAGIGYENVTDRPTSATVPGPDNLDGPRAEVDAWGGSLAALHVPSGLFAQGHYMAAEYTCNGGAASGYWGQFDCKKDSDQWLIQAGIVKNWTGLGNTAIYGEYGVSNGWGASSSAATPKNYPLTAGGLIAVNGVTDSELTVWGVGIVQNIDAAATTLYLTARHFSADVTCTGAGPVGDCQGAVGAPPTKLDTEDFLAVTAGARVTF
jgi:hypothetical protein